MVGEGETIQNAIVGAIASTVFYFIPIIQIIAPVVGGSVAGYLQKQGAGGGIKAGGIKGIVMTLPAILIGVIAGGILAGIPLIGELLTGSIAILVVIIVGHSVVLGVIGGLLGGVIS